jgi:anaerobic selenocysteine-containing dehydrogenase
VRPPEEVLPGEATWYATTDGMSPGGNGVIVRVMNGRALKIEGNPEHPLNRGKLDARGQAGLQLLYHPDRLPAPVEQNEGGSHAFRPVHWNDAVNALAEKLQEAGGAVAIWSGVNVSGHLVDLFNRYSEAVGAAAPVYYDLDAAIHGCGPLVDAQLALFNESALPAYDLAHADVIFAFNADFLGDGLSNIQYNYAYGAFRSQALGKRGFLAAFEPRMSITGAVAD